MPLYEYKCNACAHRFERIVKFSDAPLTICPQCGKNELEQLISAPAIQFKGSGWYVTDYAHKNTSPGASGPTTGSSQDSDSSSASTAKESGNGTSAAASGNGGASHGNGGSSNGNGATPGANSASTATSSSAAQS